MSAADAERGRQGSGTIAVLFEVLLAEGRAGIFRDYRLRVAAVLRDYGMRERDQAPLDSRSCHDPPGTGRVGQSGGRRSGV